VRTSLAESPVSGPGGTAAAGWVAGWLSAGLWGGNPGLDQSGLVNPMDCMRVVKEE
jgi:hypothetical protein